MTIEDLINEYGDACFNYGDYQSDENNEIVKEARKKLLIAIREMLDEIQ